jgi:hypothetical protein
LIAYKIPAKPIDISHRGWSSQGGAGNYTNRLFKGSVRFSKKKKDAQLKLNVMNTF